MNPSSRQIFKFWRECIKEALRGNSPFANDWQWAIGIPLATLVLFWLGQKYPSVGPWIEANVFTSAIATAGAAFLAYVFTWVVVVVARLFTEPAVRFWTEKDRADTAEQARVADATPRIRAFIDPQNEGVLELATQMADRTAGPKEKWMQFTVSCATNAPLIDCEVWLTHVERLDGESTENLVPEQVRCNWSQTGEKKLTIRPLREQRVNLLAFDPRGEVKVQVEHLKIKLRDELQRPGRYFFRVLVTAQSAQSVPLAFIIQWRNFDDVSLGTAV